jgi:Tfp pilus assembly protein PilO
MPELTANKVSTARGRWPLSPRSLIVIVAALFAIIAGYMVLSAGHPSAAAVLLVLGYCVLLPLGIVI